MSATPHSAVAKKLVGPSAANQALPANETEFLQELSTACKTVIGKNIAKIPSYDLESMRRVDFVGDLLVDLVQNVTTELFLAGAKSEDLEVSDQSMLKRLLVRFGGSHAMYGSRERQQLFTLTCVHSIVATCIKTLSTHKGLAGRQAQVFKASHYSVVAPIGQYSVESTTSTMLPSSARKHVFSNQLLVQLQQFLLCMHVLKMDKALGEIIAAGLLRKRSMQLETTSHYELLIERRHDRADRLKDLLQSMMEYINELPDPLHPDLFASDKVHHVSIQQQEPGYTLTLRPLVPPQVFEEVSLSKSISNAMKAILGYIHNFAYLTHKLQIAELTLACLQSSMASTIPKKIAQKPALKYSQVSTPAPAAKAAPRMDVPAPENPTLSESVLDKIHESEPNKKHSLEHDSLDTTESSKKIKVE